VSPAETSPDRARGALVHGAVALVIAVSVLVIYAPLSESEFLNWDEDALLVENLRYRGLSADHLGWMFRTVFFGHYQPLVWLSFAFDHALGGLDASAFRRSSVLLHVANALVLYGLLYKLPWTHSPQGPRLTRVWPATLGALFFALHPLRVEPVAWLASRNDLLSTFFVLLSFAAWLGSQRRSGRRRLPLYGLSLAGYVLGLASKAIVMTFPFVLLVVDAWPLRRFGREPLARLLGEKLPYFVAAAVFGTLAFLAKGESEGLGSLAAHGPAARLAQAVWCFVFYLGKTVWPSDLSPLYLLGETVDPLETRYLTAYAAGALVVAAALALARRLPAFTAALAAYALLLLPVLGFFQSGAQLAADRYTYLACLPWAVLLAAALRRYATSRGARGAAALGGAVVLGLLALLSWRQAHAWTASIRLWDRVLAVEPDNYYAYQNRGRARQVRDDLPGAIADYGRALELRPDYAICWRSRGIARREARDYEGALADLSTALTFEPDSAQLWLDRSVVQRALGQRDAEVADLDAALRLAPNLSRARALRGRARAERGDAAGAAADFDAALGLAPGDPRTWALRGEALEALGDAAGAMRDYARALALARPDWPRRAEVEGRLRALQGR
jgi:tetratricopeptide (TPR) repeat protein